MVELTKEDFELMFDALDSWEHGVAGLVMESMRLAMTKPESEAEEKRRRGEVIQNYQNEKQSRHERSVLLQAKLIALRDQQTVDALTRSRSITGNA